MTKAIFYKEWIKLRWVIAGMSGIFVALIPYLIINLHSKFRFAGKAHLWSVIADKDINMISEIHYFPLLAGLLLGLFQFIPEMNKKSFKLTLHLPHPEMLTVLKMLFFGLGNLVALFIISEGLLFWLLSFSLPPAVLSAWFFATLPWYLAGIAAYLLTCWVCIEPLWKQRAANTLVAAALISVFLRTAGSFAYLHALPFLIALVLVSLLFPFYSVFRFKEGSSE